MIWFLVICFILTLVIVFSKLNIDVQYTYDQSKSSGPIYVNVYFYHIAIYQKQINPQKIVRFSALQNDWDKSFLKCIQLIPSEMTSIFDQQSHEYKRVLPILRQIKISSFIWETKCGTGTPLTSGMACGVLWSVKWMFIRFLEGKTESVKGIHLDIQPQFEKETLVTNLHCIVSLTVGKAMIAIFSCRRVKKWSYGKEG